MPLVWQAYGTTSAYAENTLQGRWRGNGPGNYLRVRGEYSRVSATPPALVELPPRTRRILGVEGFQHHFRGTTSAYAENTPPDQQLHRRNRNYLRVRGEYQHSGRSGPRYRELPPRTRRIPEANKRAGATSRTTSAYAENTFVGAKMPSSTWNYLRVRGEYLSEVQAMP